MCVAMVIIFKKTLEKKGADDVKSKSADLGPFQAQTMTQGPALFSCGLMEASRWRELGHSCAAQQRPVGTSLESLWDVLPEVHKSSAHWDWDAASTSTAITSLLRDLSLTEAEAAAAAAAAASHSAAPPSKRQCRSLSCSEELGGCRSTWRPQGSRVWTAVEKRRCHSGGSVQRGRAANAPQLGFPAMQRSASFSLPCFGRPLPCPSSAFAGLTPSSSSSSSEPSAQPLYLSHEQICLPSPASSPDSTPELERRGGLARSRSQPGALNDKKMGVKRRRPADAQKQRPSLDLAKMTQVGFLEIYFGKHRTEINGFTAGLITTIDA
ncbi:Protein FAM53B [Liparis tanakae]|uniref:Protein FAM53B n=1 Tax=Liparis tanakae TaxID=230148 RepID=A0A4Z2I8X9_9TELE|nr:Protein FAM53B [Liparis tanakae]